MKKLLFMGASVVLLAASCGTPSPKEEEKFEPFAFEYLKQKYPEYPEEEFKRVPPLEDLVRTIKIVNEKDSLNKTYSYLVYEFGKKKDGLWKIIDTTEKLIFIGDNYFIEGKVAELRKPNVTGRVVSKIFFNDSPNSAQGYTRIYENRELIDEYVE